VVSLLTAGNLQPESGKHTNRATSGAGVIFNYIGSSFILFSVIIAFKQT
jgi:hypothetical protein